MRNEETMGRREFLRRTAWMGGAVMAGMALGSCAAPAEHVDVPVASDGASETNDAVEPAAADETASSEGSSNLVPVYFTRYISPAGLQRAFDALGVAPTGNVAVKLSTGERGSNFLKPDLIGDLVQGIDGTIVECNTAYGGQRSSTENHLQVAADNGFTAIADVDIMDADGEMSLPVNGGAHLTEDIVGSHLANYDWMLSLAHFKGHAMGGFGGALKNLSIGVASPTGKMLIHSGGTSTSSWGSPSQDAFLESMAEAAGAVKEHMGENIAYVNVMNRLSVDCDCDTHPAEPEMADIGILASTDPVAVDAACVDLVYAAPDGEALIRRMESLNGPHILDYAQSIGVGTKDYELVDLDA